MMSAYKTGADTMSEQSDPADQPTEALSNVSDSFPQENSPDPDCLKPLSSTSKTSEVLSLDNEGWVRSSFGTSEPVLPLLPYLADNVIAPLYELEFKEPALSFSFIQENGTPQPFGATSSTSNYLIKPSVTESLPICNFISDHSQATSLSRSLSRQSDSLENDATPVSDLYIFESETQDFILSPNVDPDKIERLEYQHSSQTRGKEGDPVRDSHATSCDSRNMITQCRHSSRQEQAMLDHDSAVSEHKMLIPPAVDACLKSVNDAPQVKAEVTDLIPQLRRSYSPVELWLDACQYIPAEDAEDRDVLDKSSQSVMQRVHIVPTDFAFPAKQTQVSGYSPDGSEGIRCSGVDTACWGPPVERWSSVDSWSSALSDWTGNVTTLPEDFTAAFTEIRAEIDALRQALTEINPHLDTETFKDRKGQEAAGQAQSQQTMGVQDKPLKTQNLPESSILSEQSCLSLCLQGGQGSQRVQSLCDATQRQTEPEELQSSKAELTSYPTHLQASIISSSITVASPGEYGVDVMPINVDLSHFGGYDESFDTDTFINNYEEPIILNIREDSDLEIQKEPEPDANRLCEVTDERRGSVSPLVLVAEQEAQKSFVPAEVDLEGSGPHLFSTQTLTNSHVPGVEEQSGQRVNVHIQVSSDISSDFPVAACQLEPQWGSPKFITPLAPLGSGSSLACSSVTGDQNYVERSLNVNRDLSYSHVQACIPWSTSDRIADNSEELIHRKENTVDIVEKSSSEGQLDTAERFFTERKTTTEEINDLSRELSNLIFPADPFFISEENHVAVITLDSNDSFVSRAAKPNATTIKFEKAELEKELTKKMPHKTHNSTSESKAHSKKDKSAGHHYGTQVSKTEENQSHHVSAKPKTRIVTVENHTSENTSSRLEDKVDKPMIETIEKAPSKPHSKKKKKHAQKSSGVKSVWEPLAEVENGAKPKTAKGRVDTFEAELGTKAGKVHKDGGQSHGAEKKSQHQEAEASQVEQQLSRYIDHKNHQPKHFTSPLSDDIKRRRLSEDKFSNGLESKLPKPVLSVQAKGEKSTKKMDSAAPKKSYSEVVKQKTTSKEEAKVLKSIQAQAATGDPQSLCLWCQFTAVFSPHTFTWSRDGTVLAEIKRSAGDESRASLNITNASHKDLGKYRCRLTSLHASVTLDYLLTYEVLSEIVFPQTPKTVTSAPVERRADGEAVQCSRLMFKEDFLSEQYFGENQPVSIITEKVHFGEGMHRRAFRTKLHGGQIPLLVPGHCCVLKVHNSISYGTKNSEELIQKNFSLAVEECQVQNTAREYIKAYTTAAQSVKAFGEIPEIIPIYLVHRPSNDIPYATLEEELIGDFVKYSVKDGKEVNLMRCDSEAGQKCCAFQHWVYNKTEGNLLITDMQGVGMKLTDVGIATSKKGYKGFKGNCATSFIDQFKALHQCNKYCEVLGLKSLQPKAKKPASAPKTKPQPAAAPKKKTLGPTVKGPS